MYCFTSLRIRLDARKPLANAITSRPGDTHASEARKILNAVVLPTLRAMEVTTVKGTSGDQPYVRQMEGP